MTTPLVHAAIALVTVALAALVPPPARAAPEGASPWADDHASRARLITGEGDQETRWAGLEIELEAGYKTYWRNPGDSGIPAELDWSGSRNVAAVTVEWPAPERYDDTYGAYFGYSDRVVLPVRVTPVDPSAPATLSLSLFYGVCKDICIPATGEMALTLAPVPASIDGVVAQARAAVPTPTPLGETRGPLAILGIEPAGEDLLAVRVRAPQDATLFAEGPDDSWFLAPSARMDASGVFTLEIAQRPSGVAGPVPLRLTLVGGGTAIEVEAPASMP